MAKYNWHGKYFTLEEMTASHVAKRLKIDNSPTPKVVENLQLLVDKVLDPLRVEWGRPIVVTSGYRCPKLNATVGGATQSQHKFGQAADIRTVSDHRDDNMKLLKCLLESNLPFDKCIAEFVDEKGRPDWIHVSYSSLRRGIELTCKNGKYFAGINVKKK